MTKRVVTLGPGYELTLLEEPAGILHARSDCHLIAPGARLEAVVITWADLPKRECCSVCTAWKR